MTDEELAKKAEETVKRYVCGDCNKCQSHGYIGCDVYKYSKDSFIAGAKAMQEENEQLNRIRHSIELQKQKQEMECNKMSSTIIEELQKENKQLKQQIKKLKEEKQYETCPYRSTDMGCDYCDYRDRDLKDEVKE